MKLRNIRIVCKGSKDERTEGGLWIERYPDLGDARVLAVFEDGQEIDIGQDATKIEWRIDAENAPVAIVHFLAPEIDLEAAPTERLEEATLGKLVGPENVALVKSVLERTERERQLRALERDARDETMPPGPRTRAALHAAELREKLGFARHNFGDRFELYVDGENQGIAGPWANDLSYLWPVAWAHASGEYTKGEMPDPHPSPPPIPTSLEGANRLLEKRRQATNAWRENPAGAPLGVEVPSIRIREWVDGEWL